MSELTHLVLTRFNVAVSYSPSEVRLSDAWLRARLHPFETVCLPSMRAQASSPQAPLDARVQWVVLCDAASPAWFTARLAALEADLTVVQLEGPTPPAALAAAVAEAVDLRTGYLLTTRLDSDDALARGHLARVQTLARARTPRWLDFPIGWQLADGALYGARWPSNPFLSLLEASDGGPVRTALALSHSAVRGSGDAVQTVWTRPAWLQTLHSANASSGLIGVPRLLRRPDPRFAHVAVTARGSWRRSATAFAGAAGRRLTARPGSRRVTTALPSPLGQPATGHLAPSQPATGHLAPSQPSSSSSAAAASR